MTRPLAVRASRRGLLGGLLVGVAAAGCQAESSLDTPDGTGTSPSAGDGEGPAPDPDLQLVRRVVDDLTGTLALVGGAARARRPLTAEMTPWRDLHVAHLEALEAPTRTRPSRVRGPVPELRARVRRQEALLQRGLADAAVSARSGALASLLATMSAAVAQQLAADAARVER